MFGQPHPERHCRKKALTAGIRRELVDYARSEHDSSVRRACRLMGISHSSYRYQPIAGKDEVVIAGIQAAVERYPAYGFGKLLHILRRQGHTWNHKRVHRLYCQLNLNLRRRGKKRLPSRNPEALSVPSIINQSWSMDFMSDSLQCGRRFRTFNVVDDFNREALAIEIDLNLPAPRVIRVLERIIAWRGYPKQIRMDDGPEFISTALADWAETHGIHLEFIQPGKPTQNSFVERFNRTYRDEILNMYVFKSLSQVRELTDDWIREYNEERPHESLGNLTPWEYLDTVNKPQNSNLQCD